MLNLNTLTYGASSLPLGLSINTTTGVISGTVASNAYQNGNGGVYNTLVTATDSQGDSSGQAFTWTINASNQTPTLTNPGTQFNNQGDVVGLQLQASDPDNDPLTYTATGLPPGLTLDPTAGLVSGVVSATGAGTYAVTLNVSDGTHNANAALTWTIANGVVTVTNPGTQNSTAGSSASLQINASEPGHTLSYTAAGLPAGLSINTSTGLIAGTIDPAADGVYTTMVMASDSQGNSGSQAFTWNVTATNQPPVFQYIADQLDQVGDNVSLPIVATDADGETVTYSATGLPSGLSINTTSGVISGTVGAPTGAYAVTVTATDGHSPITQNFNWLVTQGVVILNAPADQTNTQGDNVSLPLSATDANKLPLNFQAYNLPSGLAINTTTGVISGTIATGVSGPSGDYTVTVQASDSQGNSSAQQFNWTVNPLQQAPTITNPGSQSNAEGDSVSLQIQANDADGDALTYAASGLPLGLGIDQNTGLISGTIDYAAAEINGGAYMVTVTADDGNGAAVSQTFSWSVRDTDQGPWLEYPAMQNNTVGDVASLQLSAGSPDGRTLSYSATGLPAGLSVNTSTGLISGTITAAPGSYTPTVAVSDGQLNASQSFTWGVSSTRVGQVVLAINGTVDHSDDVALMGAGAIPVVVILEHAGPGLHQITLQIPSGMASLDRTTLQMADGGSATVMLMPLQASTVEDDVSLVAFLDGKAAGGGKLTDEEVTFTPIRNADTPALMEKDRIPPWSGTGKPPKSVWTLVTITLSAKLTGKTVAISFGTKDGSGNAKYGTAKWVTTTGTTPTINLSTSWIAAAVGMTQTKATPGLGGDNAGKLVPVASVGAKKYQPENGFSVAAIPLDFSDKFKDTDVGDANFVGIRVDDSWKSDSGNIRDLDEVAIKEALEPGIATGVFKGALGSFSDYNPGRVFFPDTHAVRKTKLVAPGGVLPLDQISVFWDLRTGERPITMQNSGYHIVMEVYKDAKDDKWKLRVTKIGAAVNVQVFDFDDHLILFTNSAAGAIDGKIFKEGLQ